MTPWRNYGVGAALALGVLVVAGCSTPSPTADELIRLDQMASRLDRMEREIDKRERLKNPNYTAAPDALKKIVLPGLKDQAAVRAYIGEVLDLSYGQMRFNAADPQVAMLMAVGAENLDLLIAALDGNDPSMSGGGRAPLIVRSSGAYQAVASGGNFYLLRAIENLAGEPDKALIVAGLDKYPALIEVIEKKRWQAAATPALLRKLQNSRQVLSQPWLTAVASSPDPRMQAAMTAYFINLTHNFKTVYNVFCANPRWNGDAAIRQAWRRMLRRGMFDPFLNGAMLERGDQRALDLQVEMCRRMSGSKDMTRALAAAVQLPDGECDVARWYGQNKARIFFDPVINKFKVRDNR